MPFLAHPHLAGLRKNNSTDAGEMHVSWSTQNFHSGHFLQTSLTQQKHTAGRVCRFNFLVPVFKRVKKKQRKLILTTYLTESNISQIVTCQYVINIFKILRYFLSFFVFVFVSSLQNWVCVPQHVSVPTSRVSAAQGPCVARSHRVDSSRHRNVLIGKLGFFFSLILQLLRTCALCLVLALLLLFFFF